MMSGWIHPNEARLYGITSPFLECTYENDLEVRRVLFTSGDLY